MSDHTHVTEAGGTHCLACGEEVRALPKEPQITRVSGIESFGLHPSGLDTAPGALRPCPFCGHEAAFKEGPRHLPPEHLISVWCINGACAVHTPEHYKTREDATKAWNRRAPNSGTSP